MGRKIAVIIIVVSAVYIFFFSDIGSMLLTFLLLGIVPGTNYRLTPTQMLVLIISCGGIIFIATVLVPILKDYKIISIEEKKKDKNNNNEEDKQNNHSKHQRVKLI